ncbi:unnamed protein product [Arabidopsis arenosa]|uniref:Legume lectin domain-containing protein n=1 Tax=Arabidopsis arenosa TaxID=38785 RepID=A0A8S2A9F0_ARAAE|nr:unnamed protein product [Arabidopsis arenosa]
MIMSRKINWLMVLVIIALFNLENSLGRLVFEGSAGLMNGFTTLTNTKKHAYGQAFNDEPFPFKNSINGNVTSFSFTFFFAIVPEHRHKGSHVSAPAGYYDQKGQFKNLSLISGNLLRVTILYSQEEKQLNVTLSPAEEANVPKLPLLSLNQDLSPYLSKNMYVGFTASTGSVGAIHYMWMWYEFTFIIVPQLDFAIPTFPPYPKEESQVKLIVLVTCLTLALFVALAASALTSCGRKLFEPRAESEEAILTNWAINRWENGDIVEAATERIRQDHDKGQLELVLKLGVLCSHQAEEVRPDMATVVKILNGVSELPDNLLDIVRSEKLENWYERYSKVLDPVTTVESIGNLAITEPILPSGRPRLFL